MKKLTKEQFEKIVKDAQEVQKRNPWGSKPHKDAYAVIRQAVKDFHGNDIGEYV